MNLSKALLGKVLITSKFLADSNRVKKALFNVIRLNRQEVSHLVRDDDIRFLSFCLARRAWSNSQIMQDLWVCFELSDKRNGYFVEFGATNGMKNSNTWLLETQKGWTGIVAEPNPMWHQSLVSNRNCHVETMCVSSKSGELVDFLTTNDTDPELSGIARFSEGDHFAETRRKGVSIKVSTISLDDLLGKYGAPDVIDYISIDTEGSELDILENFSISRRFRLLSVESNVANAKKIDDLLSKHGYQKVFSHFSQWDGWYVDKVLRPVDPVYISAPEA